MTPTPEPTALPVETPQQRRSGLDEDGVLWISASTLSTVASCHTQTLLRTHRWSTREGSNAMTAGHAVHAALEAYLKYRDVPYALAMLDHHYRAYATEHVQPDDRLTYDNVAFILGAWMTAHPIDTLPFVVPSPDLVEVEFSFPLVDDGSVMFFGRLDGLVQDRTSGWWWDLDWKTTGRLDGGWTRRWLNDSQITGYVWAAQQHLGQQVAGALIGGIELGKLPPYDGNLDRKCRKHSLTYADCRTAHIVDQVVPTSRTPAQLAAWHTNAAALAQQYRSLLIMHPTLDNIDHALMQGMFTGTCTWCDYAPWCIAGRQVAQLEGMLTQEPRP